MKRINQSLLAAALALAWTGAMAADSITKDQRNMEQERIAAEFKTARAACNAMKASDKNICVAEAKAVQKVANAEIETRYKPGASATHKLSVERANADFAVAREKCNNNTSDDPKRCLEDAKAVQARAKADAKTAMKSATADTSSGSVGAYFDDSVITAKVKAAVMADSSIKSPDIQVESTNGIVQLSGFVSTRADIDRAVYIARGVKGVTGVKSDLNLREPE